jgi:hypothetical protein
MPLFIILLFFLTTSLRATRISSELERLDRRNVCDGIHAEPVLYTDYFTDQCPPKYKQSTDSFGKATCAPNINWQKNGCAAFCEIRTNFAYTTEQPFANTYCHGPFTCKVQKTNTRAVAWNFPVNAKFLEGLKVGVTGGYRTTTTTAIARSFQVKLDIGQCGYFTFVPVRRESWYDTPAPLFSPFYKHVVDD